MAMTFTRFREWLSPAVRLVIIAVTAILVVWLCHTAHWIHADYRVDWTAVAAGVALFIYLAETVERRARLLASREAITHLLYVEVSRLMIDTKRVLDEMTRDETGVVDYLIARDPAARGRISDAISNLKTPVIDSIVDRLHNLARRDLRRVSAVVAHIAMLGKVFEEVQVAASSRIEQEDRVVELLGECRSMAQDMMKDLHKTRLGFEEVLPTKDP